MRLKFFPALREFKTISAQGFVLTVLAFWIVFPETTYARNVRLILPIAAALKITVVADRPSSAVKFFPESISAGDFEKDRGLRRHRKINQRACNEALLWTLLTLEKPTREKGANAS